MENNQSDHDLLIELRTEMKGVREDIKRLTDGTAQQLSDHETRIRGLEVQKNKWLGKENVVGGAIGLLAGMIGAYLKGHSGM